MRTSIPGCETLERLEDNSLKATASVKVGPISAKFAGKVQLLDLDPPNGYRIEGEGQGGVAGFAKGGAVVRLVADGAETILSYEVKAQVGGKIAQLGARLIDATAKQMADAFFDRFTATVGAAEEEAVVVPAELPKLDVAAMLPFGMPPVVWGAGAVFLVIAVLLLKSLF